MGFACVGDSRVPCGSSGRELVPAKSTGFLNLSSFSGFCCANVCVCVCVTMHGILWDLNEIICNL